MVHSCAIVTYANVVQMHMAVLLSQLMMGVQLWFAVFLPFLAYGQTIVDSFRGDIRLCETSCEKSFPGSGESERLMFSFCRRGCRLLNLIDILDDFNDLNDTKNACFKSCHDSYSDDTNVKACLFGCESQLPTAEHRKQQMKDYYHSQNLQNLSPTLYVNKLYGNMNEKAGDKMSRSYYSQAANGGLVVVAAKSSVVAETNGNPFGGGSYNFMETRGVALESVDVPSLDANGKVVHENRLDSQLVWRTCIIVKAGTPRLLIACLIVLLLVLSIWIWVSSNAEPEKGHQTLVDEEKLKHLPFAAAATDESCDLEYVVSNDDELKTPPRSMIMLPNAVEGGIDDGTGPLLPIKIKVDSV